jgi:uncharacterized protein
MDTLIKDNIDKIQSVCKKYSVKSLYLFGSAANDDQFRPESDIDFLVDYFKNDDGLSVQGFDYFDLMFSLEDITGRKIDLVVSDAVRNPYFKQKMDNQKILLYAA